MKPRSNAWHDGTGSDAPSRRNCGCLPTKYFGYTLRLMPMPTSGGITQPVSTGTDGLLKSYQEKATSGA